MKKIKYTVNTNSTNHIFVKYKSKKMQFFILSSKNQRFLPLNALKINRLQRRNNLRILKIPHNGFGNRFAELLPIRRLS